MLILLATLLCQDKAAEELHAKFEKQFVEAKSVSLKFKVQLDGKDMKLTMEGRARFKGGDRYWIEVELDEGGKKTRIEVKSDGKKSITLENGERSEDATEKGMTAVLTNAVTRCGFGVLWAFSSSGRADTAIKISGLKSGAQGKNLQELLYDCAIGDEATLKTTLELNDGSPLLPRKRTLKFEDVTVTESYEDVSLDEIKDSEFEHKK